MIGTVLPHRKQEVAEAIDKLADVEEMVVTWSRVVDGYRGRIRSYAAVPHVTPHHLLDRRWGHVSVRMVEHLAVEILTEAAKEHVKEPEPVPCACACGTLMRPDIPQGSDCAVCEHRKRIVSIGVEIAGREGEPEGSEACAFCGGPGPGPA